MVKAQIAKCQRMIAKVEAAKHKLGWSCPDRPMIVFYLHPPKRRRADIDNAHAMLKSSIDGICDGLEINDRIFRASLEVFGEPINGGLVQVQIMSADKLSDFLGLIGGVL